MILKPLLKVAFLVVVAGLATGCANTIRGVGQDTANAVDATQQAGRNIENSASY